MSSQSAPAFRPCAYPFCRLALVSDQFIYSLGPRS
ncbi:unnamed protein product, partial [Staurois parvus]